MLDSAFGDDGVLETSCDFDPYTALARIAAHQAAHHVASYLLGRSPATALTIPPGGIAGPCEFFAPDRSSGDSNRSSRDVIEARAVATLAGPEADRIVCRDGDERPASDADWRLTADIIRTIATPDELPSYMAMLQARTKRTLEGIRARAAVFVLADALLDTKSIPALEAARIVTAVLYGSDAAIPTGMRDRTVTPSSTDPGGFPVRRRRADVGSTA